jgi:hypothetical protein
MAAGAGGAGPAVVMAYPVGCGDGSDEEEQFGEGEEESDIEDGPGVLDCDGDDGPRLDVGIESLVWTAESEHVIAPPCSVEEQIKLPRSAFGKGRDGRDVVAPVKLFLALLQGDTATAPMTNIVSLGVQCTATNIANKHVMGGKHIDPPDHNEFLRFIATCLFMGLVRLPNRRAYFTHTEWAENRFVRDMWRDGGKRFNQLVTFISFYDAHTPPPEDGYARRVYRVSKLMKAFNHNLKMFWVIGEDAAGDEQTILSKHHTFLQQYNASKPNKRHLKFWSIGAARGGLLWHTQLYAGSDRSKRDRREAAAAAADADDCDEFDAAQEFVDAGQGERVILMLAKSLPGKHHHLWADNLFSSVALCGYLLRDDVGGHTYTGTLRTNRKGFQKDLIMEKSTPRGQHHHKACGRITQHVWSDTKPVAGVDTHYPSDATCKIKRRCKDTTKEVDAPEMFGRYNEMMGGIDTIDQLVANLGCHLRTRRWTNVVFFHVINSLSAHAYALAKRAGATKLTHLQFQWEIMRGLSEQNPIPKGQKRTARDGPNATKKHLEAVDSRRIQPHGHWPVKWETSADRQCQYCKQQGLGRKRCEYKCKKCDITLHPGCMEAWHPT